MANSLFITVATAVTFAFIAQQAITGASQHRILTGEEQTLADEARAEIAKVLERNLIKFFTLVAADNGRELFGRQQDDDEDDATLNPNVLPQVAQILSAIFHGGLNISRVVDRTLTLAPAALRNQVDGLFALLTGNDRRTTTVATTAAPAAKATKAATTPTPTTLKQRKVRRKTTTTPSVKDLDYYEDETTPVTVTTGTPSTTTKFQKYRLRNRNRTTLPPPISVFELYPEEDTALYRLEEEVISAAIDAEPYVRDKEPRFFRGAVNEILTNFDNGRLNLTQVIRFLPDLFQGARRAVTLLENLGEFASGGAEDDYE